MKKYKVCFIVMAESDEQLDDWFRRVWRPAGEICRRVPVEEPYIVDFKLRLEKAIERNKVTLDLLAEND